MYKRQIIEQLLNSGYEITPDALEFLSIQDKPKEFLLKLMDNLKKLPKKPLFITIDLIKDIFLEKSIEKEPLKDKELGGKVEEKFESHSETIEADIVILKDATGRLYGKGQVEDFKRLFMSRFKKLHFLLTKRPDVNGITPISEIKNASNDEVQLIGIIQSKKETGSKNIKLKLEDLTDRISAIVPSKEKELIEKASRILPDQVVSLKGTLLKNDTFIVNEIIFPDLPNQHKKNFTDVSIYVAMISDTHFGSKQFKKDSFQNFISWINGKSGDLEQKELAANLKYLIIAGDIVDGIGVYPAQKDDLEITDIKKQYDLAAEYLKQVPEHIKILIIPGGAHDAIRKALPQPAIPKKYAKSLYEQQNIIMLGNPSFIKLHGVSFLLYHGDSFDDLISSIPGLSYEHPELAMQEFMIFRHLAPIYGQKTGISPEHDDWLVIDEIPDIVHCGHVHINGYKSYKGVKLINSGCFQELTSFQKEKGIRPTPGVVPLINLQNLKIKILKF